MAAWPERGDKAAFDIFIFKEKKLEEDHLSAKLPS